MVPELEKWEPIKILPGGEYLCGTFSVCMIIVGTAGKSKGKMGGC